MDTTTTKRINQPEMRGEPGSRSVVAYTTFCRGNSPRSRAAFFKRLEKATAEAYAIEFPPVPEPEAWKPRAEKWEYMNCFHCDRKMCRMVGEARNYCRSCEKQGLRFPTREQQAAKVAAELAAAGMML
jgi:hypothetical protein